MLAAVASSSSEGDSLSGPTKDYLKRLELQAAKVISATEGTAPSGGVLLEGQLRFWDVPSGQQIPNASLCNDLDGAGLN